MSFMPEVKLPFGLKDGQYFHISQVDRGLRCNCRCPGCGAELVAKQGEDTAHHFAHRAKSDCTYQPESALHDYSKRLISRQLSFQTPNLHVIVQGDSYGFGFSVDDVIRGKQHTVNAGVFERTYEDIVPDVQLETDAGLIFVEVAVTHFVDRDKRSKLRRIGVPTVEIDLSTVALDSSLTAIDQAVMSDMSLRKWAYHPEESDLQSRLSKDLQAKIAAYELEHRHSTSVGKDDRDPDDDYDGWQLLLEAIDQNDGESTDQWLRSFSLGERVERYKSLSHREKLNYHCFLIGRRPETLPLFFNLREASGPPFLCPSIVWRTGVFYRFIAKNKKKFGVGDVVQWCRDRYDVFSFGTDRDPIDIDSEVADFLLELERDGYLKSDGYIATRRTFAPVIKYLPTISRFG
jgi:hypothetical protein